MPVDRERIEELLQSRIPDQAPSMMAKLEPFFAKAEAGSYQLARAEDLDPEQVAQTLTNAMGRKVAKVIFVSSAAPIRKESWVPDRVYEELVTEALKRSLGGCTFNTFVSRVKSAIEEAPMWEEVEAALWDVYTEALKSPLSRVVGKWEFGTVQYGSTRYSITGLVYAYLGAALLGDQELVDQLTPVLELLRTACPLGEKAAEPGTWLVLTA